MTDRTDPRRWAVPGLVVLGLVAMWLLLELAGGAPTTPPPGIPDPGFVTNWGVPVLTFLSNAAIIVIAGSLLTPLLTSADLASQLRGSGARALRTVRWLAWVWVLIQVGMVVLGASEQWAEPIGSLPWVEFKASVFETDQGQAYVAQVVLALLVAIGSRWVVSVRESSALLALTILSVVPVALSGHSNSSGSHDTAVVSLFFHLTAVVVWVGGVVALWWHLAAARPDVHERAAARFSKVAIWCYFITAGSGVMNAAVRVSGWGDLFTEYGSGVIAKTVVLILLGFVAAQLRRRVNTAVVASAVGRFARLTAIELTLMAVAVGLGVALSRTPTPVGKPYTSVAEELLSGPVPPAPTAARLLWSYTASGVGLAVFFLGAAGYLTGLVTLRRRGVRWPLGRTVSWFVGLLIVAYATFGGLGTYSHVMFSWHMVAHMALSMIAPIFLVLGDPVTLALRALPGPDMPGGRGPRQWLAGVLRSRYVRFISHPIVAVIIFVGSLYAIYFTSWFDDLMQSHLGHGFMEIHFLIAGLLFFEVIIGRAPLAYRPPFLGRLGILLLAMPFHAFFAIAVMNSDTVIGGTYYGLLSRPYATDLLHDQYVAGSITWALSEVPMVLVMIVLVAEWYRHDRLESERHDRRAARDDDAELTAYNDMLAARAAADARDDQR